MNGLLLVDKPVGCTSHDIVRIIRNLVRPAKVGHAGTLDPAASGLLILAIGSATRAIQFLQDATKTYLMAVRLGEETDTCDGEGKVVAVRDTSCVSLEDIQKVVRKYVGVVKQIPPHFSAIKKQGTPLYKLARKGVFLNLEPREVEIFSLEILYWNNPLLGLRMSCSRGTYARSVANDIGKDLGIGGRIDSLRRITSGPYKVEEAITVNEILNCGKEIILERLLSVQEMLAHIPTLPLTASEVAHLMNGAVVIRQRKASRRTYQKDGYAGSIFKVWNDHGDCLVITIVEEQPSAVIIRPKKVIQLRG